MKNSLIQVEAKRFVAGVYVRNGVIDHAADILDWTIGKTRRWLEETARRSGWKLHETELETIPDEYYR